jgi:hypothetical protein
MGLPARLLHQAPPCAVDKPSEGGALSGRQFKHLMEHTMAFWTHWRLRPKFTLVAALALGMSLLPATLAVRDRWQAMDTAERQATGVGAGGAGV